MARRTLNTDADADATIAKCGFTLGMKYDTQGYYLLSNGECIGGEDENGYSTMAKAADAAVYIREVLNRLDSIRRQLGFLSEDRTPAGTERIARFNSHLSAGVARYEVNEVDRKHELVIEESEAAKALRVAAETYLDGVGDRVVT